MSSVRVKNSIKIPTLFFFNSENKIFFETKINEKSTIKFTAK